MPYSHQAGGQRFYERSVEEFVCHSIHYHITTAAKSKYVLCCTRVEVDKFSPYYLACTRKTHNADSTAAPLLFMPTMCAHAAAQVRRTHTTTMQEQHKTLTLLILISHISNHTLLTS